MEKDSTTEDQAAVGASDDTSSTTDTDVTDESSADSGDTSAKTDDDNAPSDSEDDSADDDKSKTEEDAGKDKAPTFDKDLGDWAKQAGYGELTTDKERKLAQVARDNQRAFSRSKQSDSAAKKLADAVDKTTTASTEDDDEDPMVKRLDTVEEKLAVSENKRQASEYFAAQAMAGAPVSDEEGEAMANLLEQYATADGKQGANFLLGNVPRWHKLAKMELAESNGDESDVKADEAAEKARKEERERLAKSSQANSSTRSAQSNSPGKQKDEITKIWEDDSI